MERNGMRKEFRSWNVPLGLQEIKKESGQKGMEETEFQEFPGMGGPELKEPKKECTT
jgi:hypothetical protein